MRGAEPLTVSLLGCRMRNYAADAPLTIENGRAVVQAVACIDGAERPDRRTVQPGGG